MSKDIRRGERELECLQAVSKAMLEREQIKVYLNLAKPNPNPNNFPDFIFNNGFIEHFQVTSAKETKKGGKHCIAESVFEKDSQIDFEKYKQEFFDSKPCPKTIYTKSSEMEQIEYSYEHFVISFKRNIKNHIESLDKYSGDKTVGIFLVEHTGGKITILKNGRFFSFYKIRYDRELLKYLYSFVSQLKYVIYYYGDISGDLPFEIIEISKIPDMIEKVPNDIAFGAGRFINARPIIFLDL